MAYLLRPHHPSSASSCWLHLSCQSAARPGWRPLALLAVCLLLFYAYTLLPPHITAAVIQPEQPPDPPSPSQPALIPQAKIVERLEATAEAEADNTNKEPNRAGHVHDEELQAFLEEVLAGHAADKLYIYAADINQGTYAQHQAQTPIPSGSIYKLFLAEQVFRQAAAGELRLDEVLPGSEQTAAACTKQMVAHSSNACGTAMRDWLGRQETTQALGRQGYEATSMFSDPAAVTSAQDIALLLQRLEDGSSLKEEHAARILQYLREQLYTFRIPEGLPRQPAIEGRLGSRNKTGDVFGYTNDAAIVYGENTDYILVILSGEWASPTDSSLVHRQISGRFYNYFNDTDYELLYD